MKGKEARIKKGGKTMGEERERRVVEERRASFRISR